uniref:Uncharacterized protein n=1 Tax=Strigamia maritima TaxID=126957 RepID=T1IIN2_STRMM
MRQYSKQRPQWDWLNVHKIRHYPACRSFRGIISYNIYFDNNVHEKIELINFAPKIKVIGKENSHIKCLYTEAPGAKWRRAAIALDRNPAG